MTRFVDRISQLGDGAYDQANQPEQIAAGNAIAIAGGGGISDGPSISGHSLFVKNDGSLWAMGYNFNGQLGDGTYGVPPFVGTNLPEQIVASNVIAVEAGKTHSLFVKNDGSLWAMGDNFYGQLGDGNTDSGNYKTNLPEQIVAGPPGYGNNQMSIQRLSEGNVCSYFGGVTGTNYALDRSFNLMSLNWIPQITNPANVFGVAAFTNTPDPTTNNFWRIRSVP